MANPTSIRLNGFTQRQIEELQSAGYGNQSNIIQTAIDRMYLQEKENFTMTNEYTVQDYASDRQMWEEYIDPDNNVPFDSLTQEEREAEVRDCFPELPEAK